MAPSLMQTSETTDRCVTEEHVGCCNRAHPSDKPKKGKNFRQALSKKCPRKLGQVCWLRSGMEMSAKVDDDGAEEERGRGGIVQQTLERPPFLCCGGAYLT